MTLTEFLGARYDEDAALAHAAALDGDGWRLSDLTGAISTETHGVMVARGYWGEGLGEYGPHIARHDPARVLREVEAKRCRLERYLAQDGYDLPEGVREGRDPDGRERDEAIRDALETEIREDAAIWSDHPDYDQDWRP